MSRFFPPDEKTPGQLGAPWEVGDVFSFCHGPVENIFFFQVTEIGDSENHPKTTLLQDGGTRFAAEVSAFLERATNEDQACAT